MEIFDGHFGGLSQSRFDFSADGRCAAHHGAALDALGHCRFDDRAGFSRIVSRTRCAAEGVM